MGADVGILGTAKKAILVSRPIFWPIAPSAYLFGVYSSGGSLGWLEALQALLLSIPLGIYVFGVNDLFDMDSDRANPRRKGSIWGARIEPSDRGWIAPLSALCVIAIFASAAASGNALHMLVVALFLPFPYIYSAPPLRLKSVPVLDSLTNATYTYAPFAMGYSLSGSLGFLSPGMVLFSLVFSAAHAIGTIMDLQGDRKAGIRTFAAALGGRKAALFASAILLANLPFLYHAMKSMFIVMLAYFASSLYVLASPTEERARQCFIVMVGALLLWIAYAAACALFGIPLS